MATFTMTLARVCLCPMVSGRGLGEAAYLCCSGLASQLSTGSELRLGRLLSLWQGSLSLCLLTCVGDCLFLLPEWRQDLETQV
jgi:hypothetical protein